MNSIVILTVIQIVKCLVFPRKIFVPFSPQKIIFLDSDVGQSIWISHRWRDAKVSPRQRQSSLPQDCRSSGRRRSKKGLSIGWFINTVEKLEDLWTACLWQSKLDGWNENLETLQHVPNLVIGCIGPMMSSYLMLIVHIFLHIYH